MKTKITRTDFSKLAPLFLFTVFAVFVAVILLGGAKVYRAQVNRDRADYDHRTISQYLVTRIHQNDAEGAWFVTDFDLLQPSDSGNTLCFSEIIEGREYYTRVYCHDGYLYELFAEADATYFTPADGQAILPLEALSFSCSEKTVTLDITFEDGTEQTVYLALRSGREAAQ
ncbi:MAG: DUF4860 domain-containing protein [Oscillospiraceae bacterium]|nr:DUF4860 domain-containing protein [Oscillospiraceae bacterium]MBQ3050150.1 DUF4860 domain-containing protein [Oscillospiraceae bacterium]MBQ9938504.1 DUF4860 domain-containing protein [Oscillospiraceae bacterium]